jgi:hypothetical protein
MNGSDVERSMSKIANFSVTGQIAIHPYPYTLHPLFFRLEMIKLDNPCFKTIGK